MATITWTKDEVDSTELYGDIDWQHARWLEARKG